MCLRSPGASPLFSSYILIPDMLMFLLEHLWKKPTILSSSSLCHLS